MGILDNKVRILDTIVTLEGKKQLLNGKLKVEYATFSDSNVVYDDSSDISNRIYFESVSTNNDSIVLESDDTGMINSFNKIDNFVKDGKILKYTFKEDFITGSSFRLEIMSGSEFSSTSETVLLSSLKSFNNLQVIGTKDFLFEDYEFELSEENIRFNLTDNIPISDESLKRLNINSLEDISSDIRFSNIINFSYLPPIHKKSSQSQQDKSLGNYRPFNYTKDSKLTGDILEDELNKLEKVGLCKTLNFDPTSKNNNLLCQFFEKSNNVLRKLDIVDFGKYEFNGNIKHAFFIGKIFIDSYGVEKFIHLFTLIFG